MSFDIALRWATPSDDPCRRNRELADLLLVRLGGLTEFPIDHALVANTLGVPAAEVLDHWPQIELDSAEGAWSGAIITLWLDGAFVELPSVPPTSCEAALATIRPLLDAMAESGLVLKEAEDMVAEYERQQSRVKLIARRVGGSA